MINLFYPKRQLNLIQEKISNSIKSTLIKGDFIQGENVKKFENLLAKKTNNKYAISCANGSDAISIALLSLNIKKNDYVYIPSFSFISTVESIVNIGAIPRFIDINQSDCLINIDYLEKFLKKDKSIKNKYVLVVELFGGMPDYKKLNLLKKKYKFKLISDSAQSYGSMFNNFSIGNMVDIACLSFFPTKVLGCYGDGGALLTNKKNVSKKIKSLTLHGRGNHKYDNKFVGFNSRLDTLQASILIQKIKIVDKEIKKRREIKDFYDKNLNSNKISKLNYKNYVNSSYGYFTLICDNSKVRNELIKKLNKNKISYAIYYPKPLHKQIPYKKFLKDYQKLNICEIVSKTCISLPIDPYLSKNELNKIIKTVNEI